MHKKAFLSKGFRRSERPTRILANPWLKNSEDHMAVKGPTYKEVTKLPAGQALTDPFVRGLRYIGGKKGTYVQLRYPHPKTGKWISKGLGRLPTQHEMEERAVDLGRSSVKPSDALEDIRDEARTITQKVRKGIDPKTDVGPQGMLLSQALDLYEVDIRARRITRPKDIMSLLRRELLEPLGNMPLDDLDRAMLVQRLNEIRTKPKRPRWPEGRPGTAKSLQSKASVFLGWCVNQGYMRANPLAGYQRPRRTSAEMLEAGRHDRALGDDEIPMLWKAASAQPAPFGQFIKILLLTGQRRMETTLMEWEDVDLRAGEWSIPIDRTKSARAHRVPLPPSAVKVLRELLPEKGKPTGLVFKGRDGKPMTGWSKRMRRKLKSGGETGLTVETEKLGMKPWSFHTLRRTVRSGYSALSIEPAVSEMQLNHAVKGTLIAAYDRYDYWKERVTAARKWAKHVERIVG